jgi:membrane-bound metal-dependent hydrolase YbcI (DUF457 family)
MPNYKKHLVGGVGVWATLLMLMQQVYVVSLLSASEWLICSLAGSLFPDIDIKSKGQKYFYRVILLVFIFLIIQQQFVLLAPCSIMAIVPLLVRHRGIFHRLWFVILCPLAFWYIACLSSPVMSRPLLFDVIFFIAGAISHLWLDFGFWRMLRVW